MAIMVVLNFQNIIQILFIIKQYIGYFRCGSMAFIIRVKKKKNLKCNTDTTECCDAKINIIIYYGGLPYFCRGNCCNSTLIPKSQKCKIFNYDGLVLGMRYVIIFLGLSEIAEVYLYFFKYGLDSIRSMLSSRHIFYGNITVVKLCNIINHYIIQNGRHV